MRRRKAPDFFPWCRPAAGASSDARTTTLRELAYNGYSDIAGVPVPESQNLNTVEYGENGKLM